MRFYSTDAPIEQVPVLGNWHLLLLKPHLRLRKNSDEIQIEVDSLVWLSQLFSMGKTHHS